MALWLGADAFLIGRLWFWSFVGLRDSRGRSVRLLAQKLGEVLVVFTPMHRGRGVKGLCRITDTQEIIKALADSFLYFLFDTLLVGCWDPLLSIAQLSCSFLVEDMTSPEEGS